MTTTTDQTIYNTISQTLINSGTISSITTFSDFAALHPDCSFLNNTETQGLCHLPTRAVFINDRQTPQEQLLTLLHETAHILTGSNNETVCEAIAQTFYDLAAALIQTEGTEQPAA